MPSDRLVDQFRRTLGCYEEPLLRQVAQKLCRPRNQWPTDELVERIMAALANPVTLDRRLKDLPIACRQLLALIGHSRQPTWPAGSLVELLIMLDHADGLAPVVELLGVGLLIPDLGLPGSRDDPPVRPRVKAFEQWLTHSASGAPQVVAWPQAAGRALGERLSLPACPDAVTPEGSVPTLEADGLEWPLRLAVLRQQVAEGPLRRTQQGEFFKRDLERLRGDPLLSTPPDSPVPLADTALLTVQIGLACGVLREQDTELFAGDFSAAWEESLPALLADLWASLPRLSGWDQADGGQTEGQFGNPHASAALFALVLLGRLPVGTWAAAGAIEEWINQRHPLWRQGSVRRAGIASFLLGVAYLLRLVEARRGSADHWLVRLSPLGRWAMGLVVEPPAFPSYPQTLLVQPNLEILAYRQGLTPRLIVALSRFANWKGLGPACTLQLEPKSVYRGLEAGETLTSVVQTLERYGMKALPPAVLDSLRTWSNKRERITVYASAALFEFATAAELSEAIARGLPAQRLTDRVAVVANEADIDYRQFRLTGTRDYCLPPERCVEVESDGVTLNVDLVRSDLLLEIEVQRFAESVARSGLVGRRFYRLTPHSLAAARDQGVTPAFLARWFEQRTEQTLPPAARLLLTAMDTPPVELRREIVLHVTEPQIADGLQQWPGTRTLIQVRLGPTAFVVAEKDVEVLSERLRELGIGMQAAVKQGPS
jgi:hypothetical protein